MSLVSSAFFSILVNGTPSQLFTTSRVIHQGDTLSPFFFIIIIERLCQMLNDMHRDDQIRGLNLSEELEARNHQQFVDDTMCMGQSTIQEDRGIKSEINTFLEANGLEIKREKS